MSAATKTLGAAMRQDAGRKVRLTPTEARRIMDTLVEQELALLKLVEESAELRAAGLVQGEVGISREDAQEAANWLDAWPYETEKVEAPGEIADRLRAALGEK